MCISDFIDNRPYVPFYKPYGMTDEEYQYEIEKAQERLAEWEHEQEYFKNQDSDEMVQREKN